MGELVSSDLLLYLRYADDILLGFKKKASIPQVTRVFAGTIKELELEVKSERIRRQEKGRSSSMKVLGMICCITSSGQISIRAPFMKWEKKLSLALIKKEMEKADAPKTLAAFFPSFLSMITPYLYFSFGCPCAKPEKEIFSYFRSLLRRRSLEFVRQFNPIDKNEYRTFLAQYESKLFYLLKFPP